ncbi:MAG: hypothetical protein U1E31_00585 [Rickettsiales bacterium]
MSTYNNYQEIKYHIEKLISKSIEDIKNNNDYRDLFVNILVNNSEELKKEFKNFNNYLNFNKNTTKQITNIKNNFTIITNQK